MCDSENRFKKIVNKFEQNFNDLGSPWQNAFFYN